MSNLDETQREAAAVIERLLDAARAGELEADTPQGRRLLRRMEGSAAAWGALLVTQVEAARR